MPHSSMDPSLEADLAQIRWPLPHLIPAINEDIEEEPLLPLEGPLMDGLPHVRSVEDLGLPIQGQSLPPQDQGPVQRLQPDLHSFSLPEHWPVYEEMTYLGVEEDNQEEWDAHQNTEEEEDEREEGIEEEITLTSKTSQEGPVDVGLLTKRRPPVVDDNQLLRDISSSAEPQIATIGLQVQPMPDATPPAFVPTLQASPIPVTSDASQQRLEL